MKVILTSEFHRVADKLLKSEYITNNKKVAFIQNAVDGRLDTGEIIDRVEAPKEWYRTNGLTVDILDLRTIQGEMLFKTLQKYDYLHIHGGDNKHLHDVCKSSGLFGIIHKLLDEGLVYIGSSAGSLITGPNTTYSIVTSTNFKSEFSQEELEAMDFTGFQLHPFYLIPHSGKPSRLQVGLDRLHYCEEHKLSPYLTYADDQAIIIEDNIFHFIQ